MGCWGEAGTTFKYSWTFTTLFPQHGMPLWNCANTALCVASQSDLVHLKRTHFCQVIFQQNQFTNVGYSITREVLKHIVLQNHSHSSCWKKTQEHGNSSNSKQVLQEGQCSDKAEGEKPYLKSLVDAGLYVDTGKWELLKAKDIMNTAESKSIRK